MDGSCVHTTLATKSQSSQGGRASSVNVISPFADSHEGEICDIWMDDRSEPVKWVTGGTDGRVKYWELVTTETPRSGKRPAEITSNMVCLFSSPIIEDTLPGRSEAIRRRQTGKPDDVVLVRCAPDHGIACGITEDGDLRVWFGAESGQAKEVRIDAGSAEDMGVVKRMELEARDASTASILVHHYRSSSFIRFDVVLDADGDSSVQTRTLNSPVPGGFSALQASLRPSLAISAGTPAPPFFSTSFPSDGTVEASSEPSPVATPLEPPKVTSNYGRLVATGDEHGVACLWAWDEIPGRVARGTPLRAWPAVSGRITAIEVSCGLVAVGRYVFTTRLR
jgi:WD40 repeat protein